MLSGDMATWVGSGVAVLVLFGGGGGLMFRLGKTKAKIDATDKLIDGIGIKIDDAVRPLATAIKTHAESLDDHRREAAAGSTEMRGDVRRLSEATTRGFERADESRKETAKHILARIEGIDTRVGYLEQSEARRTGREEAYDGRDRRAGGEGR